MPKPPVRKTSDFIFDWMPLGELAQVLYYPVRNGAEIVGSILVYPNTCRIIMILGIPPDEDPLHHNK